MNRGNKSLNLRVFFQIHVVLFLAAMAARPFSSQPESGKISGTVRNSSGAPVTGAQVTLMEEGGSVPLATTLTTANGQFVFDSVKVGKYKIAAESPGFLEASALGLNVGAQSSVVFNLTLVPDQPPGGGLHVLPGTTQLNPGVVAYYERRQMRPADATGAIDPGGYSAPGHVERGGRLLEGAVRLQNNSPEPSPGDASGHSLPKSKELNALELELRKAVESLPNSFQSNHKLGEFYIQVGKLPQAIPYLEKAYGLDPSNYVNAYDLALAELETENFAAARKQIVAMIRRQNTAELHNLLGEVEEKSGNYLEAAKEYELAAHLEPSEKHIFDWGVELLRHQTLEPAIEVFRRGVERYPRAARMWIGFGTALYSRGQYDEAVKAFSQATDLDPTDPRPYSFLAQVYSVSSAEAPGVVERLRRFAELQPKNPQALYSYALALWKGGRGENAQADLSQVESLLKSAAALDPRFAEAHLQLGIFYAERKEFGRAVEEYEHAIKLNSTLSDAHYRLGQALVRTGEKARAQEEFETYERLHKEQVAETDKRRAEIRQFVYSYQQNPRP